MGPCFWNEDEDVDLDCVPGPLGYRIWQERLRLGMNQKIVAESVKVGVGRYKNIERGVGKYPDTYLIAALGNLGMDVSYIMMGKRSQSLLRPDEAALLDNYRNSNRDNKAVLRKVGAALEKQVDDGEMCA